MKIAIVLGTRPEIIKMSPIIRYCAIKKIPHFVIHTNQHYSANMDKMFFSDLKLKPAKYNLNVGRQSSSHGKQTGLILQRIEPILHKEQPLVVLVEGDTNTVLAGALAATKLHIPVGHVEAGLRSYDFRMPEEKNRRMTDHISDFLFCPTETAKKNALKEGIYNKKIFVTGNTIVDAIKQNLRIAQKDKSVFKKLDITQNNYFLVTAHREENVDSKKNLSQILKGLSLLNKKFGIPVVYPIHPRTVKRIMQFGITYPKQITFCPPLKYLDFVLLIKHARLNLTDSGGIQEEACILKIPCITLRENTERPETIQVRSNTLAGTDPKMIIRKTECMLGVKRNWNNPFGSKGSAERIVKIILKNLN